MCYYFNDIMRAWDIDIDTNFSGFLFDEKLHNNKKQKYFNLWHSIQNFNGCKTIVYKAW